MNLDTIPSGAFSIEVPVRFSRGRSAVLGGIHVPVQGMVSGDIYSLPKALRVEWTSDKRDAFVLLQSRASISIKAISIEKVEPNWVETAVVVDSHQLPTIRISPKSGTNHLAETFAGYVIVRGTTNKEQRIKIPFYGSIKG